MCRPWSKRIDISCKYFEPQSGDHCVTGGRAASSAVQRSTKTAAMATGFKRADGGITIDDLSLEKRHEGHRVEIRAPVGGLFGLVERDPDLLRSTAFARARGQPLPVQFLVPEWDRRA